MWTPVRKTNTSVWQETLNTSGGITAVEEESTSTQTRHSQSRQTRKKPKRHRQTHSSGKKRKGKKTRASLCICMWTHLHDRQRLISMIWQLHILMALKIRNNYFLQSWKLRFFPNAAWWMLPGAEHITVLLLLCMIARTSALRPTGVSALTFTDTNMWINSIRTHTHTAPHTHTHKHEYSVFEETSKTLTKLENTGTSLIQILHVICSFLHKLIGSSMFIFSWWEQVWGPHIRDFVAGLNHFCCSISFVYSLISFQENWCRGGRTQKAGLQFVAGCETPPPPPLPLPLLVAVQVFPHRDVFSWWVCASQQCH